MIAGVPLFLKQGFTASLFNIKQALRFIKYKRG